MGSITKQVAAVQVGGCVVEAFRTDTETGGTFNVICKSTMLGHEDHDTILASATFEWWKDKSIGIGSRVWAWDKVRDVAASMLVGHSIVDAAEAADGVEKVFKGIHEDAWSDMLSTAILVARCVDDAPLRNIAAGETGE